MSTTPYFDEYELQKDLKNGVTFCSDIWKDKITGSFVVPSSNSVQLSLEITKTYTTINGTSVLTDISFKDTSNYIDIIEHQKYN